MSPYIGFLLLQNKFKYFVLSKYKIQNRDTNKRLRNIKLTQRENRMKRVINKQNDLKGK